MKIFITGESGTIPLAIQDQVAKNYFKEFEIVNRQIPDRQLANHKAHQSFKIRQPEIDFTDRLTLDVLSNDFNLFKDVEVIIHSGAFVGTDFCNSNPNEAIRTNVEGTRNIVEICNKFGINLVYLSTTAIFDPKDYSQFKPITEETHINPQTLYGITKYAGEMIVRQLCQTPKLIVRPVFGFGNYPEDLHSALTKSIYTLLQPQDTILQILLDKSCNKSYTRVENIAYAILELISRVVWNTTINIGTDYTDSKNWFELFSIIQEQCSQKLDFSRIKFDKSKDYLHYHNIDNIELRSYIGSKFEQIHLYDGIADTIKSVINSSMKPYWL